MKLGWVDFSEKDRKRALEVIQNLTEQGAVDELGIGVVRDAFSDYFFPGTSTVQTRAKYFFLSPYIIRDVCRTTKGITVKQVLNEIDSREREFALRMKDGLTESSGLIGYRALTNGWVARKPYDIYWNGIRTFGILKRDISLSDIIKYSIEQRNRAEGTIKGKAMEEEIENTGDDSDAGTGRKISFWQLPETPEWSNNYSIELTIDEAIFLENRIKQSCDGKLIEKILSNRIDIRQIDHFDLLREKMNNCIDDDLKYMMDLASAFSKFTYCARTLYNLFLLGEDKVKDKWEQIESNPDHFAKVDINAIFYRLKIEHYSTLKTFLLNLQNAVINKDWERCRIELIDREKRIKGASRAKLLTKDKYKTWIGGEYLDYRYGSARRLITDIYNAKNA